MFSLPPCPSAAAQPAQRTAGVGWPSGTISILLRRGRGPDACVTGLSLDGGLGGGWVGVEACMRMRRREVGSGSGSSSSHSPAPSSALRNPPPRTTRGGTADETCAVPTGYLSWCIQYYLHLNVHSRPTHTSREQSQCIDIRWYEASQNWRATSATPQPPPSHPPPRPSPPTNTSPLPVPLSSPTTPSR